jgi:hypothetical protein
MQSQRDDYNKLADIVNKGDLAKLSEQQLKEYHKLLANNGRGVWTEAFYWRISDEIKTLIYQKEKDEADSKRHHEIQDKLDELKRPHWSTNYNFAATVIAAVASCVAVVLTVYQIRASHPVSVVHKPEQPAPPVQLGLSSLSTRSQPQLSTTCKKKH